MSIKEIKTLNNSEQKSVLGNYLEKSGLSLWLKKDLVLSDSTSQCELVRESEYENTESSIVTLANCGCGSGSNCSC